MGIISSSMTMLLLLLLALSCFSDHLWLIRPVAAVCPTLFLPSDVSPTVKYNYSAAPFAEFLTQLQKTVPAALEQGQYAAYAMVVVHWNKVVFTAGLADTPFRIGSITKTFTALSAMLLREKGALSLDDHVTKFLPSFSILNPYSDNNISKHQDHAITLRELMGHVSGLPRDLCGLGLECYIPFTEAQALRSVAEMELLVPPWSDLPLYSNLGFSLLGHAWEKATSPRKSWGKFVRDEILTPLHMTRSGSDFRQLHVELATGDSFPGTGYHSNTSLGWGGPAGDMYSTANDMAKYMKFLVNPEAPPHLLSRASFREWTHVNTLFPDNKGSGFALPWELQAVTTTTTTTNTTSTSILVTKGGSIGSYNSILMFHPGTQLGVTILTSAGANTTGDYMGLASTVLTDFIPVVQLANSVLVASWYSGTYTCDRTPALVSPNLNASIAVEGGCIEVTASPSQGLLASVNLTTISNNNVTSVTQFSSLLVLKKGRENEFWVVPIGDAANADCLLNVVGAMAAGIDTVKPNRPGSTFLYEIKFSPKSKLLLWPSLGGVCHKIS